MEGDDYAHSLVGFDRLIEIIGIGFENVNKLLKELRLSYLFNKYNELYKIKSMDGDSQKITDEIKGILPEIRDNFFLKLKNPK